MTTNGGLRHNLGGEKKNKKHKWDRKNSKTSRPGWGVPTGKQNHWKRKAGETRQRIPRVEKEEKKNVANSKKKIKMSMRRLGPETNTCPEETIHKYRRVRTPRGRENNIVERETITSKGEGAMLHQPEKQGHSVRRIQKVF